MRPVRSEAADWGQCGSVLPWDSPSLTSMCAMLWASATSRGVKIRTPSSGLKRELCSSVGAKRRIACPAAARAAAVRA